MFNDIKGLVFGELTPLEKVGRDKYNYSLWKCKCSCGNEKIVSVKHLKSGDIKSCGCIVVHKKLKKGVRFGRYTVLEYSHCVGYAHFYKCLCDCGNISIVRISSLKKNRYGCSKCKKYLETANGFSRNRIYKIWKKMLSRCYNSKEKFFYRYGKRGITVCDEWKNDFMAFYNWANNNGYKKELTIDRINNNGNYCPENCRWATRKEQANNTSRNKIIEFNGTKMTASQWSEKIGIKYQCFLQRIKRIGINEKVFNKNIHSN